MQEVVDDAIVATEHMEPLTSKIKDPEVSSVIEEKVGVESFVIPSLELEPESLTAARLGAEGAFGDDVSIVTSNAEDTADSLPVASELVAVIDHSPSDSPVSRQVAPEVLDANEQVAVSRPLVAVTVVFPPFSDAATSNVSDVFLVRSSVALIPESDALVRFGVLGANGAVVSRVIVDVDVAADPGPVLPAASDAPFTANRG